MIRKQNLLFTVITIVLLCTILLHVAVAQQNLTKDKTIRNITVQVRDIFDGDELAAIYRGVNSLKINTKQSLVKRELLFKEGDHYNQFRVDESARNLRRLSFIGNIKITPKFDGDFVDIEVSVQDNWTLVPQLSFSSGGGSSDQKSIGLSEGNVLGYGKRAEVLLAEDEGRRKLEGVWDDIRFNSTFERLLLGAFDRSDGYRLVGLYGRPFRTLVDKDSWSSYGDVSDTVGRLFEGGSESYIFRQKYKQFGARYTYAFGDPSVWLRRFSVGYEYEQYLFQTAVDADFEDIGLDQAGISRDPSRLAKDRKFSAPFLALESIIPDYFSSNYIDRFEWVEDLNLGQEIGFRGGFASKALGSDADTFLPNLSYRRGLRFDPKQFMRWEFGGASRMDSQGVDNSVVRGELKYFNLLGDKEICGLWIGNHTIAASFALDYANDLDRNQQLLLGVENGLRGFDSREFAGNKRLLLNVEDRFHLVSNVFQFMSFGGAFFFDVGGASYRQLHNLVQSELYPSAGLGMRIAFPKSSGGNVLRIDIAFPLRASPDEDNSFQPRLVISSGQAFSARLRAESLGIEKANVGVGLDR
jgi:hypothetical protein